MQHSQHHLANRRFRPTAEATNRRLVELVELAELDELAELFEQAELSDWEFDSEQRSRLVEPAPSPRWLRLAGSLPRCAVKTTDLQKGETRRRSLAGVPGRKIQNSQKLDLARRSLAHVNSAW